MPRGFPANPDPTAPVSRPRSAKAEPLPARVNPPGYRGTRQIKRYPGEEPMIAKGNSARDRIAEWIAIRTENPHLRQREIAERIGIRADSLAKLITRARKEGWLQFDDPLDKIEYQIVPKVLDNLVEFLDAKDKTVTLETAKGTIFKQYQGAKGVSDAPTNVLALKIEMPDGANGAKVITGQIVGQPRALTE